jgi:hypothetical protein
MQTRVKKTLSNPTSLKERHWPSALYAHPSPNFSNLLHMRRVGPKFQLLTEKVGRKF